MTNKIDYSKILEVQIRDGVARQDTPVWWHSVDGVDGAKYLKTGEREWANLVKYPLYYSLQEPTYTVTDEYGIDYGYEDPYGD